jgi:2'-5' RNA ligase
VSSTGYASKHRLFLACPIPGGAAAHLVEWTAGLGIQARLVPPDDLHATLAFYGLVGESEREVLATLTRAVRWSPVYALVGQPCILGRNALAVGLIPESLFAARLRRWRSGGGAEAIPSSDPLGQLCARHTGAGDRRGRPLRLHITVARLSSRGPHAVPHGIPPPALDGILLEDLVLYESFLTRSGPIYAKVAQALRLS